MFYKLSDHLPVSTNEICCSKNGCVCPSALLPQWQRKWQMTAQHGQIWATICSREREREKEKNNTKFLPWGGTPSRPCGSRTGPLPPPRRSWSTRRRSRCVRAAGHPEESWSSTSNISSDRTRTTAACSPSEAPCRTVCSGSRTAWRPAPSRPRPRPHPRTWRPPPPERLRRTRLRCHPPLRASFLGLSTSCSAADAHSCFHPHDCLPPAQGEHGRCSLIFFFFLDGWRGWKRRREETAGWRCLTRCAPSDAQAAGGGQRED